MKQIGIIPGQVTNGSPRCWLNPQDPGLTVEGLPAPLRATLIARKP
ncbi:DUF1698 domain-containing protein [Pseudomonas oryzihabitans]|nr:MULTISPECIES: DUF1698 domain-containing protein [Pseudomonas]NRH41000.1 DUF1698 domain-containing protein [Pseudomonas sp. MS15a(2019)]QEU03118.1 DUF1698 domain-containing protein [Pseudomonas oryzihabitans]